MTDVIEFTKQLIARESITPNDAGCQQLIINRLAPLNFTNESLVFHDTTNLWARRGTTAPVFCFAGHTDVVPTGDVTNWHTPPFEPTIIDGQLYGRGGADMKGSLAAMLLATEKFIAEYPDHQGSIAFLLTSDEEGPFINGTTKVVDTLKARNEIIDYCIVGEPSSHQHLGDIIKNGRRGSISGELTVIGKQGHVAYPEQVKNPIHLAMPALTELAGMHWDNGNAYFPPTSFQISNIQAGTGATNVVPNSLTASFNLRYSTELTDATIVNNIETILTNYQLNYQINWTYNGQPFITEPGQLVNAVSSSIREVVNIDTQLSTSGGTSDGRFIAAIAKEIIELGPSNKTIHQVNECVSCEQLEQLVEVYYLCLKKLLT